MGTCKVTFTKVDGSERVMLCTLNAAQVPSEEAIRLANLIPEPIQDKHKYVSKGAIINLSDLEIQVAKHRKINPNVVNAYSEDSAGWRSFRVDSVKSFINSIGEECI
jgi:hypothetical protein